jgi:malic enzyme
VIQWEDFKHYNALRILDRYRDRVPSFNDDVQGTSAVVVAGVLAALRHLDQPLAAQRILLVGAGAAGIGIGRLLRAAMAEDGMSAAAAAGALAIVDSRGLVHERRTDLDETKRSLAMPADAAATLGLPLDAPMTVTDVIDRLHPTIMVGTTGVAGSFTEPMIRSMAAGCARPVILPLSNPTANTEARPEDILRWSDGRALVATGSPFPPVVVDGVVHEVGQANNVFVFPGIGIGAIVSEATGISDAMVLAAARTLAAHVGDERLATGALYPPISGLRSVSRAIGLSVAREAVASGYAPVASEEDLERELDAAMWWPSYVDYSPA